MVGAATGNNVMSRNRVEISYFILILRLTLRDGRRMYGTTLHQNMGHWLKTKGLPLSRKIPNEF